MLRFRLSYLFPGRFCISYFNPHSRPFCLVPSEAREVKEPVDDGRDSNRIDGGAA